VIHSIAFLLFVAGQPELGQRGTTFTLAAPAGVIEMVFYTPGVACPRIEAGKDGTTLHLKAAADCRLGEHAYRLRTASGFGPLATLQITPFPVVAIGDEPPTTPAKARKLPLNSSVGGKLDSEDEAHFAVTLTKGQRFSAELQGVRLGRGPIDLWLRVTGPDGKTITEVDDTSLFRQDPFISLSAPHDGTYLVSVGQSGDGRDQEPYVLHVGDFARPVAIFPLGGQAGKKLNVRHLGVKGETEATQEITLPTTPGTMDLFTQNGPKGTSAPTAQPLRVVPYADVNETVDSADASKAPRAERWPVAFNGILARPDERDHFRFAAKKGDVVEFNVFAWRVGSPLDSLIEVYGPDGRLLGQNDDDATHDSRLQVTIEADGDQVVRIRDKRKAGGPLYTYRIEVDRPTPALAAFLPTASRKSQSGNSLTVPRGNRVLAYLGVQRQGDEGPVTLTPGDLPRGVRMTPARIAADEYLVPVVLEADADAPLAGVLVPVTAKSERLTGGFRQVVDLARGPGDSSLHSVEVDRLAIAVTNAVPYRVSIVPPTTGLTADGTLEVRVRIEREKDFTGDLDVTLPLLPHGVEGPIKQTVTGTATEAVFPLVASGELRPGTWPLVAEVRAAKTVVRGDRGTGGAGGMGMGTGGGRRSRRDGPTAAVASSVVMLPLVAAPITGKIAPVAGELGKTVRVVCTLEGMLPGAMQATLDGLPPRAKASPMTVKPGERSVTFDVTLDPTTPAGKHPTLSVVLAGSRDGSKLSYRVGHGGLLLAAEPGKLAIGKDGKPLSPLEALRAAEKAPGEKAPSEKP
jgi:hypothetical protein